jgi:hypothetical protein
MATCCCGTNIGSTTDYIEEEYCSYYCRRFDTEGLQKVPLSEYFRHKNQFKYPIIEHNCDWCGSPTKIQYSTASGSGTGSGRFCGRDCYFGMMRSGRKRTKVRYSLLRILSQRGATHRDTIVSAFGRWESRHTNTKGQVSMLLSIMVRKGWVVKHPDNVYELIDTRPIGQLAII